jgi:hypothetical protein
VEAGLVEAGLVEAGLVEAGLVEAGLVEGALRRLGGIPGEGVVTGDVLAVQRAPAVAPRKASRVAIAVVVSMIAEDRWLHLVPSPWVRGSIATPAQERE